jgi:hypothetical protein
MKSSPREKALREFQRLRRWQCADGRGYVRCVSCGKLIPAKQAQGGHYESRADRVTELEPDNVWPQCPRCNGPLSGNLVAYRDGLLHLIGGGRLGRIEDMAMAGKGSGEAMARLSDADKRKVVSRRNGKEYADLAKRYRKEADTLEREKGNK